MSNFFRPKIEDPRPPACSISVTQFVPTEKRNPSEGAPTIKSNSNEIFHPTKLKKRTEREEQARNKKTAQRTTDKQIARLRIHCLGWNTITWGAVRRWRVYGTWGRISRSPFYGATNLELNENAREAASGPTQSGKPNKQARPPPSFLRGWR